MKLKRLIKKIKSIFTKKVDVNLYKTRSLLYQILDNVISDNSKLRYTVDTLQLHLIECKTDHDLIKITITLGRPGLLIGTHGFIIDEVQSRLENCTNYEVKIYLKEYDVFGRK